MYNLNYTPTTLGVQVEEKLYMGVREQKRVEYHCSKALKRLRNLQYVRRPGPDSGCSAVGNKIKHSSLGNNKKALN
jgi:hypothetical protein